MLNIILFGPPGAGKGTQSAKLIDKYNLTHIATGDLFRMHLGEGTPLGLKAKEYMNEGLLVPDSIVIGMVEEKIASTSEAKGFIFDGFPRTVAQAEALDSMMSRNGMKIDGMIALEVPDQELKSRIAERGKTSGRADDQDPVKIEKRIQVYKEETLPVANYFDKKGKFVSINGVGSIDDIFFRIIHEIDKLS